MENAEQLIKIAELANKDMYANLEARALFNQKKVLHAFRTHRIAARHFAPTDGYGYDDVGRDALCAVFAAVFQAEAAIVSPLIINGTHAIMLALTGLLRPGDTFLSVTGRPYDTLSEGIDGHGNGSLRDFGILYREVALKQASETDFEPNISEILTAIDTYKPAVIFVQRSRGYAWRNALTIDAIRALIAQIRAKSAAPVVVDNCYGEFVETQEPTETGENIIVAGSLIKNPGGGIAPTGGYICGPKLFLDKIAGRLTVPGIGMEAGSYAASYRPYFQGLFLAPHTVLQALKAAALFGQIFDRLGYETSPQAGTIGGDIITAIRFHNKDELVSFCQAIQACSPIDSFVKPEPWDMPGYQHQVIMAAGTFVQGASIELSADAPIKTPYTAYVQGSLTYEHAKLSIIEILKAL